MMDFSKRRVTVVGDIMLDWYIRGFCARVSPEAPVPVVDVESMQSALGGAGNVAANCASLGCQVDLVGACGQDASTDQETDLVHGACRAKGIEPWLYPVANCNTVKTRIIANGQQVVRCDVDGEVLRTLVLDSDAYMNAHAIILSDYGKGVVSQEVAQKLISTKIPVFIDPKDGDWEKYRGAFCIKPNEYELERHLGYLPKDEQFSSVFAHLAEKYGFRCILLTRGAKGMVLWRYGWNGPAVIGAVKQEVFDVSGAGDTAIAVFAAAQELGLLEAAQLANRAAGIVVGKRGTSVITKEELS